MRSRCDRVELHGLRAGLDGLLGLPDPAREIRIEALDLRAPGIQGQRPVVLPSGLRDVQVYGVGDLCEPQPGFRQLGFERPRSLCRLACAPEAGFEWLVSVRCERTKRTRAARMSPRVVRVLGDGLIELGQRFPQGRLLFSLIGAVQTLQVCLIGTGVRRAPDLRL